MLRVFFFTFLLSPAFAINSCYNCATTGLKFNWKLTGFPYQPADITYDDRCLHNAAAVGTITGIVLPCPSTCVEMIIPTGTNTYEALRGCYNTFTGGDGNFTLPDGVAVPDMFKCFKMQADNRGSNAVGYCMGAEEDEETGCNTKLFINGQNALNGGGVCTEVTPMDCVACTSYDGNGKCNGNSDGRGKGSVCAKITGKLNDHDYLERGATNLLPTTKTEFCTTLKSNQTLYYGPTYGASLRTKRAVNQGFDGQICYCNDRTLCNGTPTVMTASVSLVALVALVPFFC